MRLNPQLNYNYLLKQMLNYWESLFPPPPYLPRICCHLSPFPSLEWKKIIKALVNHNRHNKPYDFNALFLFSIRIKKSLYIRSLSVHCLRSARSPLMRQTGPARVIQTFSNWTKKLGDTYIYYYNRFSLCVCIHFLGNITLLWCVCVCTFFFYYQNRPRGKR